MQSRPERPVEEYALTYSTGKKGQDVTLEVGQWNDGDKAKSQYDTLADDGLFPKFFGEVHPKYRTPFKGTWFFGILTAISRIT